MGGRARRVTHTGAPATRGLMKAAERPENGRFYLTEAAPERKHRRLLWLGLPPTY